MLKEFLRLLPVCLIITVVMFAFRGFFTMIHDPLDSVPTCRGYGYGEHSDVHMNEKTEILSIQCTRERTKREKQK